MRKYSYIKIDFCISYGLTIREKTIKLIENKMLFTIV